MEKQRGKRGETKGRRENADFDFVLKSPRKTPSAKPIKLVRQRTAQVYSVISSAPSSNKSVNPCRDRDIDSDFPLPLDYTKKCTCCSSVLALLKVDGS